MKKISNKIFQKSYLPNTSSKAIILIQYLKVTAIINYCKKSDFFHIVSDHKRQMTSINIKTTNLKTKKRLSQGCYLNYIEIKMSNL